MTDHHFDEPEAASAVLRAMVLLSTLAAATEVWHQAEERAAGRDASHQETPAFVRPYLLRAAADLEALLLPLQASVAYTALEEEAPVGATVRRFEDLLKLHRIARNMHVAHQRLLSLYPAVSEGLVEEARRLLARCEAVAETEAFPAEVGSFVARALRFAARMRRELLQAR